MQIQTIMIRSIIGSLTYSSHYYFHYYHYYYSSIYQVDQSPYTTIVVSIDFPFSNTL